MSSTDPWRPHAFQHIATPYSQHPLFLLPDVCACSSLCAQFPLFLPWSLHYHISTTEILPLKCHPQCETFLGFQAQMNHPSVSSWYLLQFIQSSVHRMLVSVLWEGSISGLFYWRPWGPDHRSEARAPTAATPASDSTPPSSFSVEHVWGHSPLASL